MKFEVGSMVSFKEDDEGEGHFYSKNRLLRVIESESGFVKFDGNDFFWNPELFRLIMTNEERLLAVKDMEACIREDGKGLKPNRRK